MHKQLIYGIVLIVLLLAAFGAYHFHVVATQRNAEEQSQAARQAYVSGNFQDTIQKAQAALRLAQAGGDPNVIANAEIQLGSGLFVRNIGTDRTDAAVLFKKVAADTAINRSLRAIAYTGMAEWLYITGNSYLMQQIVFNTPPYSEVLSKARGNVLAATLELLKTADALQPRPNAPYIAAVLQAQKLSNQTRDPKNAQELASAKAIREDIATGDARMASTTGLDDFSVTFLDLARTTSLAVIYIYFNDISTSTIDASYDATIAAADKAPADSLASYYGLVARLGYAVGLNVRETGQRDEKIRELLSSVSNAHNSSFDSYVSGLRNRAKNDYLRMQVARLVALSPDFKKYLEGLGWQF